VLGTAAEAAYHRGDYARADRLGRAGLERATDEASSWYCTLPLAVAALARGAHAEVVERCSRRPSGDQGGETLVAAALATAYAGDLDRARELPREDSRRGVTLDAGVERVRGRGDREHRRARRGGRAAIPGRAVDLARGCGATFLAGVAAVGLVALHSTTGRVGRGTHGYRDVVDYFARTGNWPHLWPALRNLADLLRRIGDLDPPRFSTRPRITPPTRRPSTGGDRSLDSRRRR
jgi:hypothetical protein